MPGDGQEPWSETGWVLEAGQVAQCPQKGVLDDVSDSLSVVDLAGRNGADGSRMRPVKFGKRLRVARTDGLDEVRVASRRCRGHVRNGSGRRWPAIAATVACLALALLTTLVLDGGALSGQTARAQTLPPSTTARLIITCPPVCLTLPTGAGNPTTSNPCPPTAVSSIAIRPPRRRPHDHAHYNADDRPPDHPNDGCDHYHIDDSGAHDDHSAATHNHYHQATPRHHDHKAPAHHHDDKTEADNHDDQAASHDHDDPTPALNYYHPATPPHHDHKAPACHHDDKTEADNHHDQAASHDHDDDTAPPADDNPAPANHYDDQAGACDDHHPALSQAKEEVAAGHGDHGPVPPGNCHDDGAAATDDDQPAEDACHHDHPPQAKQGAPPGDHDHCDHDHSGDDHSGDNHSGDDHYVSGHNYHGPHHDYNPAQHHNCAAHHDDGSGQAARGGADGNIAGRDNQRHRSWMPQRLDGNFHRGWAEDRQVNGGHQRCFRGPLAVSGLPVGTYQVEAHCGVVLTASLDVVLANQVYDDASTVVIIIFVLIGSGLFWRRLRRPN